MLTAGRSFKSYRILELVGAGGSGAVYRAVQEPLGRVVALNPRGGRVWLDLGLCYRNDLREADARRTMALACLLETGDSKDWLNLLLALAREIPNRQEPHHPLRSLLLSVARVALIRNRVDDVAWFLERGDIYTRFGLRDEAREDYETVLAVQPRNRRALAALAAQSIAAGAAADE